MSPSPHSPTPRDHGRPGPRSRRQLWRTLVPVVCLLAGVGFATSANDSQGTDLRAPGITDLTATVRQAEARVQASDREYQGLARQLQAELRGAAAQNSGVAAVQRSVAPLLAPGGLTSVHGPGVSVVLDDAPPSSTTDAYDNNRLVHQSDVQAVVNALWAGGAEAMSINGQRIVATSAIRCVGPTLLLNGEVYSPPYRVAAIGPSGTMLDRLTASPGVQLFRSQAEYFGLGYTTETDDDLTMPAYTGSVTLTYARPA